MSLLRQPPNLETHHTLLSQLCFLLSVFSACFSSLVKSVIYLCYYDLESSD